jgi:hypothetical protein
MRCACGIIQTAYSLRVNNSLVNNSLVNNPSPPASSTTATTTNTRARANLQISNVLFVHRLKWGAEDRGREDGESFAKPLRRYMTSQVVLYIPYALAS